MATSVRLRKLNHDYEERVYAGLIGLEYKPSKPTVETLAFREGL